MACILLVFFEDYNMSHSQKQHKATDICGIRNINFEIVMAPLVMKLQTYLCRKQKHFDWVPLMLTSLPCGVHGGKCLSPSFLCSSGGCWWQHHAPAQFRFPQRVGHMWSVAPASFWRLIQHSGLPLYAASFQGQAPLRRPCSPLLVAGQGSPA